MCVCTLWHWLNNILIEDDESLQFLKRRSLGFFSDVRVQVLTILLHAYAYEYFNSGLGSRQIFSRLRLLTFFSSCSGSWFFSQSAPAPGFFFKRLRLRLQEAKNTRLRLPSPGNYTTLYYLQSPDACGVVEEGVGLADLPHVPHVPDVQRVVVVHHWGQAIVDKIDR